jgi:hypothetical protein
MCSDMIVMWSDCYSTRDICGLIVTLRRYVCSACYSTRDICGLLVSLRRYMWSDICALI